MKNESYVNIRLKRSLHKELKLKAVEEEKSVTQLLEELVIKGLGKK